MIQVSLLEYRNRARKSTDHQKSTDTPHSSGHSSPVSPSAPLLLLSNALTSLVSQMPASSLQSTLNSSLLGIGGSLSDNAISPFPETTVKENLTPLPQFEAISPGDSDNNWDATPVHSQDGMLSVLTTAAVILLHYRGLTWSLTRWLSIKLTDVGRKVC